MIVLGIETSCDETSVAILKEGKNILSEVIYSQDRIHEKWGGVVPEIASRQHIKIIDRVVREALMEAKLDLKDIDLFSCTRGPGLIGSLLVGLTFTKSLAYSLSKPFLGVDHLHAHIESAFLENEGIEFPILALVVSGGHTSMFYMEKPLEFQLLGKTRDDAAGEILDKISKFLGIGYPGGPAIEGIAKDGNPDRFKFSIPVIKGGGLDFSFSGIKTAAYLYIKKGIVGKDSPELPDFLASFQKIIIDHIISNIEKALKDYKVKSLILSGGVARNGELRRRVSEKMNERGIKVYIPSPRHCTDNGSMVASLAYKLYMNGKRDGWDTDAYARFSEEGRNLITILPSEKIRKRYK
jgi:N6-L-threonylcarbamoyladenine synthase